MGDAIRKRDEILEVVYWMRGEGLREAVRPSELRPLVGLEETEARTEMDALVDAGLLEKADRGDAVAYRLTEVGEREAGRRFVESFSEMLGQGHGTACAPGCECESPGEPADDCPTHGKHAHGHSG
ncbi:MAG: hypothetical protein R3199_03620 [Gemmatimonadota bacterium]|nr:hypothetical protein [Gemmatimonadota bacterium]